MFPFRNNSSNISNGIRALYERNNRADVHMLRENDWSLSVLQNDDLTIGSSDTKIKKWNPAYQCKNQIDLGDEIILKC